MSLVTEPTTGDPLPPAPRGDDRGHGGGDEPLSPWWHSPIRLLAMAVALVFLGTSIGWVVASRSSTPPAEGSVDVGFLQDMRYHHDQAVQMALIYTAKGPEGLDPTTVTLAKEVLLGQQLENGLMVQMLRTWGRTEQNETGRAMGWMGMDTALDHMVGIASPEQMTALRKATGKEADRLYLEMMLAHHQGGVHMAEYAARRASTGQVRELANAMRTGQLGEIDEMTTLQQKLGFATG